MQAIKYLLISVFIVGIVGCSKPEPKVFGVPQSEFSHMSPEQRQATIDAYNQQQAHATEMQQRRHKVADYY